MASKVTAQRQQRAYSPKKDGHTFADLRAELQAEYQNYKNLLQQLAQKIGDIEQETEEHK